MSKVSDDLSAVWSEGKSKSILQRFLNQDLHQDYPGFIEFAKWNKRQVKSMIRTAQYNWNGAEPWDTSVEAMMDTSGWLSKPMASHLAKVTGAGLDVGYTVADPRFADYNFDDVFTTAEWEARNTESQQRIVLDLDAMNVILEQLTDATAHFAHVSGFPTATGEATKRIWRVWENAVGSCSIKLYISGIEAGKKWKEDEILEGILKASESN